MKFVHLKSKDDPHHLVVSVGYEMIEGKYGIQVARCRPPDVWNRRIAHQIIEGRMKKHGSLMRYDTGLLQTHTIEQIIASDWHPDFGSEIQSEQASSEFVLGAC